MSSYLNSLDADLSRYEIIRDQVFEQYANIYSLPLKTDALAHTSMVDSYITLLAQKRELPLDLAKVAAILHDYARYHDNISSLHAVVGAKKAKDLLLETGLFSQEEIYTIITAIGNHSRKELIHHPLDEALKDADTLAHWAMHPQEKPSAVRLKRLASCFEELGLLRH